MLIFGLLSDKNRDGRGEKTTNKEKKTWEAMARTGGDATELKIRNSNIITCHDQLGVPCPAQL
jgi:hypothetical protein